MRIPDSKSVVRKAWVRDRSVRLTMLATGMNADARESSDAAAWIGCGFPTPNPIMAIIIAVMIDMKAEIFSQEFQRDLG